MKKAKTGPGYSSSGMAAAPAGSAGAAGSGGSVRGERRLNPEERYRLIAEPAYRRAEQRGFVGGDPVDDWLQAEREIDGGETPDAKPAGRRRRS